MSLVDNGIVTVESSALVDCVATVEGSALVDGIVTVESSTLVDGVVTVRRMSQILDGVATIGGSIRR